MSQNNGKGIPVLPPLTELDMAMMSNHLEDMKAECLPLLGRLVQVNREATALSDKIRVLQRRGIGLLMAMGYTPKEAEGIVVMWPEKMPPY